MFLLKTMCFLIDLPYAAFSKAPGFAFRNQQFGFFFSFFILAGVIKQHWGCLEGKINFGKCKRNVFLWQFIFSFSFLNSTIPSQIPVRLCVWFTVGHAVFLVCHKSASLTKAGFDVCVFFLTPDHISAWKHEHKEAQHGHVDAKYFTRQLIVLGVNTEMRI